MENQYPRTTGLEDTHGNGGRSEAAEHLEAGLKEAWEAASQAIEDWNARLDIQNRIEQHPYRTLAAALGIGYVLGGGLFTRLTGRIVGTGFRLGVRLAALPILKDQVQRLLEASQEMDTDDLPPGPPL